MNERQLQDAIIDLCKLYGLRVYHPWLSVRSSPGWPDLAICGKRMLFRELKSDTGRLTKAQHEWGVTLGVAGQDWDVWRPADLRSGHVQKELEALR